MISSALLQKTAFPINVCGVAPPQVRKESLIKLPWHAEVQHPAPSRSNKHTSVEAIWRCLKRVVSTDHLDCLSLCVIWGHFIGVQRMATPPALFVVRGDGGLTTFIVTFFPSWLNPGGSTQHRAASDHIVWIQVQQHRGLPQHNLHPLIHVVDLNAAPAPKASFPFFLAWILPSLDLDLSYRSGLPHLT